MSGHDGPEHRKRGSKQARHRFGVIVWVQLFTLPIPEYPMQDKASRVSVSSLQNETNNSLWGIELLRAGPCNHWCRCVEHRAWFRCKVHYVLTTVVSRATTLFTQRVLAEVSVARALTGLNWTMITKKLWHFVLTPLLLKNRETEVKNKEKHTQTHRF